MSDSELFNIVAGPASIVSILISIIVARTGEEVQRLPPSNNSYGGIQILTGSQSQQAGRDDNENPRN